MPATLIADRYTVLSELGQGSMGQVLKILDPQQGAERALKLMRLPTHGRLETAKQAFRQEYQILSNLSHPRTVQVFDFGELPDGTAFFTMEVVEGPALESLMPLEGPRAHELLVQLLDVLAFLHRQGFVHGDLKPENLRLDANNELKLMDFGLLRSAGQEGSPVQGTPHYLAPEVIRQERFDGRADLYAAGCVFYHLLAGEPPFSGDEVLNILNAHLRWQAPCLASLRPDLDPALIAVIERLMAKAPEERYLSAEDALVALGVDRPESSARLLASSLIGRQAELAALGAVLADARQSASPRVVVITGEPGMGKTRLLDSYRAQAQLDGIRILRTAVHSGSSPYAPWVEILQGLLPTACGFDPGLGARAAAVLGAFYPGLDSAQPDDPRLFRLHLIELLAEVMRVSAGDALVVSIDDWYLADAATQSLLGEITSRLSGVPIVFQIIVRETSQAPVGVQLPLGVLIRSEAARLIEAMLGYPPSDPDFAERLAAHLGGHPAALEDALALLVNQGDLHLANGSWDCPTEENVAAMPSGIGEVLGAKIDKLSPAAHRVAAVLALSRRPAELTLLSAVVGEADALPGAFELVSSGLAVAGSAGYELRSDSLADKIAEGIGASERKAVFAALCTALEAAFEGMPASLEDQGDLAFYALGAELGLRAARLARQAAQAAIALYAIDEARRWLSAATEALEREEDPAERRALTFWSAEVERHAGRQEPALAAYERLLAMSDLDPVARARSLVASGICLNTLARPEEAAVRLQEGRLLAEELPLPEEAVRAAAYLGRMRVQAGDADGAIALLEPALASARAATLTSQEATCLGLLGLALTTLTFDRQEQGLAALGDCLAIREERRDTYGLNDAYMLKGNAQLALGDFEAAERSFQENLRCCRELGVSPDDQLTAELNLALVALERGFYDQASKELGRLSVAFVQDGNRFLSGYARAAEGLALACSGCLTDSLDAFSDAEAIAEMLNSAYLQVVARGYGAEAALVAGRGLHALELADTALALVANGEASDWLARLQVNRAEALFLLNETERCLEAAAEATTSATRSRANGMLSRLQRLRGRVAAMAEQYAEAARLLESAYRMAEGSGQQGLMAEAALERANVGRQRGELTLEWLNRAVEFAEVGGYLAIGAEASYYLGREENIASRRERWFARAHELIVRALDGLSPAAARSFLSVGSRELIHRHLTRAGGSEAGDVSPGSVNSLTDVLAMPLGDILTALGAPRPTSFPDSRILGELEDLVSAIGDAKALCNRIARWLAQRTSAERSMVLLYDSDGAELARQSVDLAMAEGSSSVAGFAGRFVAMVQRDRRTVRTTDSIGDPRNGGDLRTLLAMPLLHRQELLGIIYVDARASERALGDEDVALIQMLASYASVGVFNARLLARSENALRSARALSEVAKAIASTMELDDLAVTLLTQCLAVTGAERGYVMMGGGLEILAARDSEGRAILNPKVSNSIARKVLSTCQAVVMTDAPENLSASHSMLALEIQSVMAVPLVVKDMALGVIYVSSHATRLAFGSEHLATLESIAAQAALSVNNSLLFQDLRDTLNRERQAQLEKSKMARYMSSAARQAATDSTEGIEQGGQLTMATVMFADIRGFTSLSERMSPQQIVVILNTYLTRMERIITRHGGILDKFMGDGIMAVFLEAPDEAGRDAIQAVLAASAMQEAVAEMNAQMLFGATESLRIGIGLNSGEVVAGNIGSPERMDYTVIGDNVNLAARLESNAKPGQILVSSTTAGRVGDAVALAPIGALTVKGKAQAVEVFEIAGDR